MRPALVLLMFLALLAPRRADVRVVRSGEDLQAALNAAKAGDEIRLEAGATFTGNFVLPVFAGNAPVTIRTDLPDSAVPAGNQRVTPETASRFARLVSPNSHAAVSTAPGAHDWHLVAFEMRANRNGAGDILQIGDGSAAQADA